MVFVPPILWGKPVTVWLGMVLGVLLFSTAAVGYSLHHGWLKPLGKNAFALHMTLAALTILVAIVHGTLGLLMYFG